MPARNTHSVEDVLKGTCHLYQLTQAMRPKAVNEVADLLLATLNEQGPLPIKALRYHVNRVNRTKLTPQTIESALLRKTRLFFPYTYMGDDQPAVYMTKEQYESYADWEEIPEDYAHAYYELATYVKLVRQNPEYATAPLEQLRTLGVI